MSEDFGKTLRSLRTSRSMTVNQLAMYSGISSATISRIENGKRGAPKPPNIKKLANALKYPYNQLMKAAGHFEEGETSEYESSPDIVDPFILFELVDKMTDDEIIKEYRHQAKGKDIDDQTIRNHLAYIRFLKSQSN